MQGDEIGSGFLCAVAGMILMSMCLPRAAHAETHHAVRHASTTAKHAVHEMARRVVHKVTGHEIASRKIVHKVETARLSSHEVTRLHYAERRRDVGHIRMASAHYYRPTYRHSYIECVPYAREISHVELSGDAFLWWAEAAGHYQRGSEPAPGAILNFRSIRRMPLGHVAVVEKVINNREILVNQANWEPGRVTTDVPVIDVSPRNDWTDVQVALGDGRFGSSYPTYGFIYSQAPSVGPVGTAIASNNAAQPAASEVAEAPRLNTSLLHAINADAPDHNLK